MVSLRGVEMEVNLSKEFELHKKWIDTIGEEGEMLNLDGVDLRGVDLSNKLVEQAYLIECNFDELKLENIDFHTSLLCSSTFKNAYLNNCDFYKSDLRYADFSNCIIKKSRFSKSDCWEVGFKNAVLIDCKLNIALFYLTDFSNAKLEDVDISLSTFEETLLKGVTLKNIKGVGEAHIKSINIGTQEKPIILLGEEARKWLIMRINQD